jgi:hypothetical protein
MNKNLKTQDIFIIIILSAGDRGLARRKKLNHQYLGKITKVKRTGAFLVSVRLPHNGMLCQVCHTDHTVTSDKKYHCSHFVFPQEFIPIRTRTEPPHLLQETCHHPSMRCLCPKAKTRFSFYFLAFTSQAIQAFFCVSVSVSEVLDALRLDYGLGLIQSTETSLMGSLGIIVDETTV